VSNVLRWTAILVTAAGGCLGSVDVRPPACEQTTGQACVGGGSGAGAGSGGADGAHQHSKRFGDAERQRAFTVAVDGSDNILLVGEVNGEIDFGGGPVTEPSTWITLVVAKFDPELGHLQSKGFGYGSSSRSVAADSAGNVLLTGYFQGTIDFGGGPLQDSGNGDVFVAKLDPGLGHLHSERFGDAESAEGRGIASDAAGNVIVAGYFRGSIDFGGGPLTSPGGEDVFLAKFDPALGHLHSKRFGGEGREIAFAVAVDAAGNVVVTGVFDGSIDFGGGPLTSAGDNDVFVAKFDPQLNHLWSKSFGDPDVQVVSRVAIDAEGNVVLAGYFRGSIDFGGGPLASAGGFDAFVVKLDPQLGHLESKRFGDAGDQVADGLAIDGAGNVVLAGGFTGSIDFGGGPLTSAGSYDLFVAKLDPQLEPLWGQRFGDEAMQEAIGAAVDGAGNVILTGQLDGSIDFGEGPLTSAGDGDIFLAKLPPW
jgi:hypothetical protein